MDINTAIIIGIAWVYGALSHWFTGSFHRVDRFLITTAFHCLMWPLTMWVDK